MEIIGYVLTALFGALVGGFIRWWNAYSEQKGKNLATKEDIDDLVEQTRKLTQTTREIEAKIDDNVWNRQKQWELKRDILLDFVRVMREFDVATLALGIAIKSKSKDMVNPKPLLLQRVGEKLLTWEIISTKFEQSIYLALLVAGDETIDALQGLSRILRDIAGDVLEESNLDAYASRNLELAKQLTQVRDLIRWELSVPSITRSDVSSAAQAPAPSALRTAP